MDEIKIPVKPWNKLDQEVLKLVVLYVVPEALVQRLVASRNPSPHYPEIVSGLEDPENPKLFLGTLRGTPIFGLANTEQQDHNKWYLRSCMWMRAYVRRLQARL